MESVARWATRDGPSECAVAAGTICSSNSGGASPSNQIREPGNFVIVVRMLLLLSSLLAHHDCLDATTTKNHERGPPANDSIRTSWLLVGHQEEAKATLAPFSSPRRGRLTGSGNLEAHARMPLERKRMNELMAHWPPF